jgi:hypothetical protein
MWHQIWGNQAQLSCGACVLFCCVSVGSAFLLVVWRFDSCECVQSNLGPLLPLVVCLHWLLIRLQASAVARRRASVVLSSLHSEIGPYVA